MLIKLLIRQRLSRGISSHFVDVSRSQCLIGRRNADIGLSEGKCSRQHALIYLRGSELRIRDLESTNGTILNGKRLRDEATLRVGDDIRIGDCLLTLVEFRVDSATELLDGRWHEWRSEDRGRGLRLVHGEGSPDRDEESWRKAA